MIRDPLQHMPTDNSLIRLTDKPRERLRPKQLLETEAGALLTKLQAEKGRLLNKLRNTVEKITTAAAAGEKKSGGSRTKESQEVARHSTGRIWPPTLRAAINRGGVYAPRIDFNNLFMEPVHTAIESSWLEFLPQKLELVNVWANSCEKVIKSRKAWVSKS